MTNIEQFTRELMLAHDIDYWEANKRAEEFYKMLDNDRPEVLNDWISVEDRLPEGGVDVLAISNRGFYRIDLMPFDTDITHWQPLPEPPKDK